MNYQKVYMNQIYSSNMMGYLSQMWRNQLLCDAVIKTGNIITKAHRIVLIAACPMLQNMENASLGSHLEVRMASDIKQESVNALLQYIYEGYMMLTEDNCKDIEKMAKLLQVESVVKCCADFYKCLSAKTGVKHGGPNMNYQDSPDFKHFRVTQIQKLFSDGALKRGTDSSQPASPGAKRQRVHHSGAAGSPDPDVVLLGSTYNRSDDRSSMSSSYKAGNQDPFERVPRLGSGHFPEVQVIEDSLEVVHKDPPERDPDGWPKESRLPHIHRSQAISVSSQLNKETNLQIVNIPNETERNRVPQSQVSSFQGASRETSRPSTEHTQPHFSPSPKFTQRSEPQRSESQRSDSQRPTSEIIPVPTSFHSPSGQQPSPQAQKINIDPLPPLQPSSFQSGFASRQNVPSSQPSLQTPPRLTSKPFAAGSASQASDSQPSSSQSKEKVTPVTSVSSLASHTSTPSATKSELENITIEQATTEQIQNVVQLLAGGSNSGASQNSSKSQSSTSDLTPDLSIIKVEGSDTGGLDMYVDLPDDTKAMIQSNEDACESDDDGDYGQGEASNEGSNFSSDQMGSWQGHDGTFPGPDGSFTGDGSFQSQGDGSFQNQDGSYQGTNKELEEKVPWTMQNKNKGHFECQFCRKEIEGDALSHYKKYHYNQRVHMKCSDCGKRFTDVAGLLEHNRSCLQCQICGKLLSNRANTLRHMKTFHSNERRFSCPYCKSSFKHKCHLKDHSVTCRFSPK